MVRKSNVWKHNGGANYLLKYKHHSRNKTRKNLWYCVHAGKQIKNTRQDNKNNNLHQVH